MTLGASNDSGRRRDRLWRMVHDDKIRLLQSLLQLLIFTQCLLALSTFHSMRGLFQSFAPASSTAGGKRFLPSAEDIGNVVCPAHTVRGFTFLQWHASGRDRHACSGTPCLAFTILATQSAPKWCCHGDETGGIKRRSKKARAS